MTIFFYIRYFLPGGEQCLIVHNVWKVYLRHSEKDFALNLINGMYLKSLQQTFIIVNGSWHINWMQTWTQTCLMAWEMPC